MRQVNLRITAFLYCSCYFTLLLQDMHDGNNAIKSSEEGKDSDLPVKDSVQVDDQYNFQEEYEVKAPPPPSTPVSGKVTLENQGEKEKQVREPMATETTEPSHPREPEMVEPEALPEEEFMAANVS